MPLQMMRWHFLSRNGVIFQPPKALYYANYLMKRMHGGFPRSRRQRMDGQGMVSPSMFHMYFVTIREADAIFLQACSAMRGL